MKAYGHAFRVPFRRAISGFAGLARHHNLLKKEWNVPMMRKIGVLTSGGDAPGMNAAVMSIARSAAAYGMPLIGIKHGYNGLLRKSTSIKDDLQELYLDTVLDIADQPGTYLRTARCEEFKDPKWREIAVQTLKAAGYSKAEAIAMIERYWDAEDRRESEK